MKIPCKVDYIPNLTKIYDPTIKTQFYYTNYYIQDNSNSLDYMTHYLIKEFPVLKQKNYLIKEDIFFQETIKSQVEYTYPDTDITIINKFYSIEQMSSIEPQYSEINYQTLEDNIVENIYPIK